MSLIRKKLQNIDGPLKPSLYL